MKQGQNVAAKDSFMLNSLLNDAHIGIDGVFCSALESKNVPVSHG